MIIAIVEFIAIVVLVILLFIAKNPPVDPLDEYGSLDEYCQIYEDERCEEETYDETDDYANLYIDHEVFGDSFLNTYARILKSEPIPLDSFYSFVILSEYYTDKHSDNLITGENNPTTYYASSREIETNQYLYPGNVLRTIKIDIPEEGCATFDFSADFSLLQYYHLEEGACDA